MSPRPVVVPTRAAPGAQPQTMSAVAEQFAATTVACPGQAVEHGVQPVALTVPAFRTVPKKLGAQTVHAATDSERIAGVETP